LHVEETKPVLSVQNVKKRIGKKWIIKGVSFDIHAGEIFGFLGPNGSGKTTTIRMLVDLIRPTEGRIWIGGQDIALRRNEALQQIGCIVENPEMYPYLTGLENLEHFARMIPDIDNARIHEVIDIVGMRNRIYDKVKTYSLGMRQRLGIAQALLSRPKLLILDEPTNGLDPQGIKELRIFIRRLSDEGLSLFISSHLLSEIQMMCDRVAIISHGEVIAVGGVDELLQQRAELTWLYLTQPEKAQSIFEAAGYQARQLHSAEDAPGISIPGAQWLEVAIAAADMAKLNKQLTIAEIDVYVIEPKKATLEQLFLGLTEGEPIE
jgi:ABC-2 type transport system ATP-binding protein